MPFQLLAFQSTRPARGATAEILHREKRLVVSIHAPRAGRDGKDPAKGGKAAGFQSTRPARGAT